MKEDRGKIIRQLGHAKNRLIDIRDKLNKSIEEVIDIECGVISARQFLRSIEPALPEERLKAVDALDTPELMEILADIEHERWSGWMRYFYENNTPENNKRWQQQMVTKYVDLPEHSKESDRREVRKTLGAIRTALNQRAPEVMSVEKLVRLLKHTATEYGVNFLAHQYPNGIRIVKEK